MLTLIEILTLTLIEILTLTLIEILTLTLIAILTFTLIEILTLTLIEILTLTLIEILTLTLIEIFCDLYYRCGECWYDTKSTPGCRECEGFPMTRPCPICNGQCNEIWSRNVKLVSYLQVR
jgi:hypothetical protein